jgi:hypothetical protein
VAEDQGDCSDPEKAKATACHVAACTNMMYQGFRCMLPLLEVQACRISEAAGVA